MVRITFDRPIDPAAPRGGWRGGGGRTGEGGGGEGGRHPASDCDPPALIQFSDDRSYN